MSDTGSPDFVEREDLRLQRQQEARELLKLQPQDKWMDVDRDPRSRWRVNAPPGNAKARREPGQRAIKQIFDQTLRASKPDVKGNGPVAGPFRWLRRAEAVDVIASSVSTKKFLPVSKP